MSSFNSLAKKKNSLQPPKAGIVYQIVSYLIVFPVFRILFRGRVFGLENVPQGGSLIVVANHGSHIDPPLLGHALGRPVSFMAKSELFQIPILGNIIRMCAAYPVKRGSSDREAIRTATNRLSEGWAIGVFLDGTRQLDGRINNPMAGAALLAARTNSLLLPVAIKNSHRALAPGAFFPRLIRISMHIDKPISPPISRRKTDLESTTKLLQSRINIILDT